MISRSTKKRYLEVLFFLECIRNATGTLCLRASAFVVLLRRVNAGKAGLFGHIISGNWMNTLHGKFAIMTTAGPTDSLLGQPCPVSALCCISNEYKHQPHKTLPNHYWHAPGHRCFTLVFTWIVLQVRPSAV